MDLAELRTQWSDVLDELERNDRMAWIVYFDARLAKFDGVVLTLDFSDSEKFASGLGFTDKREQFRAALTDAVRKICGIEIQISRS